MMTSSVNLFVKRLHCRLLVLVVGLSLALVACGDDASKKSDTGGGTTNNTGGGGTGTDGTGTGGTGGSGTSDATCEEVCSHILSLCGDTGVDQATCVQGCEENVSQTGRNCAANTQSCADIEACDSGGGGGGGGGGETNEMCFGHDDCLDTGFCYRPTADATTGTCTSHDLGTPCRNNDECTFSFCFKEGLSISGTCSVPCSDNEQCPGGTTCQQDAESDAFGCK